MSIRPTLLPALAALLAPLLALPAGSAAGGPTPMCGGLPATIVADGERFVQGTPGDDVISARQPERVRALGGNDFVCVASTRRGSTQIDAGPGNDTVRTTGTTYAEVQLGAGSDDFVGTGGEASVDAGDALDVATGAFPGRDRIGTHTGFNRITSGAPGTINQDLVKLKTGGHDDVTLQGEFRGSISGSAADDILRMGDQARAAWTFDLATGRATAGGEPLSIGRFGTLDLTRHTWSSLAVSGSAGADAVLAGSYDRPVEDRGPVAVALKGGNDMVTIGSELEARLDGGRGRDLLDVTSGAGFFEVRGRLVVDLPRARYTVGSGDPRPAQGFERVWGDRFRVARVTGTNGPDDVDVVACVAVLRGRGGNDDLSGYDGNSMLGRGCRAQKVRYVRAYGGGGNDDLSGGPFADRLVGGSGRDVANGFGGQDRCAAERQTSC